MATEQPKKFGAFAGVFTPSILTILGVIMYMRLGWVVGQAGLLAALGIILLSHVISISTGLSISSIATDKKIRTGGIYYMLSRSLGLPIGGAIGITIFVGTAFSIALYIIGFCENFLSIQAISNTLGMGETINDYRILGSAILVLLAIIALISTSLAIKAQFFILTAIALSLGSVFAGVFIGESPTSDFSVWMPTKDGFSMITVFAIFFPAVTGFTAGVAMSGDLKNPRKNIPMGTLFAIIVGFIVYIALAAFFALYVDRDLLLTDKNFLMKIALISPLVVAGIWGATLSSALGGILGAPRILQAISKDRITPKVFGKGYGINNEPRNALIFTFIIAELGVLIGQLDVIAAIVTMFYIAAYGFINLAFALEKWASTDFRPTFRISMWVGIIGFIACFAVMFKIDTLAMIGALVILAGIYFYIKRKKLALEYGDVWQSVRSAIIRSVLKQIDKKGIEERNWRPNILLFSGGTRSRPYLIQFGVDLAGKQGLLSNFDLILNRSAKVLFKKHQQSLETAELPSMEGIFTRRHECKDIYEGIGAIASTYGFSGVEPNTVILGWARYTEDPVKFVALIKTLSDLDLNILMVDYDKEVGFGKKSRVDIWCRGGGNNCSLMLTLIKFLWMSETWRNATARILIINPVNDEKGRLIADAEKVLDKLRMDAEIKIINNQIEQRPVNEIIQVESSNSDLVFLGIPEVYEGQEQLYIDNVNKLCENIGTAVLVKASQYFREIEIGSRKEKPVLEKSEFIKQGIDVVISRDIKVPEIKYPQHPVLAEHVNILHDKVKRFDEQLYNNYMANLFNLYNQPFRTLKFNVVDHLQKLKIEVIESGTGTKLYQKVLQIQSEIQGNTKNIINSLEETCFSEQFTILEKASEFNSEQLKHLFNGIPEEISYEVRPENLKFKKGDAWGTIRYKAWNRFLINQLGIKRTYTVKYRKLYYANMDGALQQALYEVMQYFGVTSFQYLLKIQKLNETVMDHHMKLDKRTYEKNISRDTVDEGIEKVEKLYNEYIRLNEATLQSLYMLLMNKTFYIVQQISNDLSKPDPNKLIKKRKKQNSKYQRIKTKINKVPKYWLRNMNMLNEMNVLQMELYQYILELRNDMHELVAGVKEKIDHLIIKHCIKMVRLISTNPAENASELKKTKNYLNSEQFVFQWDELTSSIIDKIKARSALLPKSMDVIPNNVYENFKTEQYSSHKPQTIYLRDLAKYLIKNEFIEEIVSNLEETKQKALQYLESSRDLIDAAMQSIEKQPEIESEQFPALMLKDIEAKMKNLVEQLEKLSIKSTNQILERRNAISDKFSLLNIMRNPQELKKFIRR